MSNQRIVLASYPEGWVTEANFRLETAPVPKPGDGEVLVKNHWLSLDPYMRGRMSQQKSYAKGLEIGEVMTGETAGEVVESKHPGFKPGDKVTAGQAAGWQQDDYADDDSGNEGGGKPLDPVLGDELIAFG